MAAGWPVSTCEAEPSRTRKQTPRIPRSAAFCFLTPGELMVRDVVIFDTTLRDGEQAPGNTMTPEEKMQVARQLDALNVDVIEAGFPAASAGDYRGVQEIAAQVRRPVLAALARCTARTSIPPARRSLPPAAGPSTASS